MKKEKRKLKEGKVKKHERTINRKGVKDTKADCRQIDEYRPKTSLGLAFMIHLGS